MERLATAGTGADASCPSSVSILQQWRYCVKSPLSNSFSTGSAGDQMMRKSLAIGVILAIAVASKSDARRPAPSTGSPQSHPTADCLPIDYRLRAAARLLRPPVRRAEQAIAKKELVAHRQSPGHGSQEEPLRLFHSELWRTVRWRGRRGEGDIQHGRPCVAGSLRRICRDSSRRFDLDQQDDAPLGLGPEKGDKIIVRRGSLGAFYLSVNGQPGIRVKRIG